MHTLSLDNFPATMHNLAPSSSFELPSVYTGLQAPSMKNTTVGPTNGHFVAMEVLQVAITGRGSNAVSAARARFWRFGPATWLAGCTASYRGASGSVRCRRAVRRYPRLWFSGALFWVFSRQIAQQRGLARDGATESGLKDARIYVSELA